MASARIRVGTGCLRHLGELGGLGDPLRTAVIRAVQYRSLGDPANGSDRRRGVVRSHSTEVRLQAQAPL